ncbi:cytochrome P450 [Hyaloscypha variabilis F]|uniref:Cytochrome P450 n=1 Tax=Hyaloscypha variabilis (strain UAMH 11265 / GT02V1 / F) TaxID=1149755 RepID=A0A2J6RHG0_HYAVF|nr:cytochrome P450 [Hyaloscypha variabilis F]
MTIVSTAIGLVVDFRWYIIAALVVVYSAKGYAEYRRLRAFNGPFLAQWTDLWLAKAAFGTNQCGALADVCANYGSIARVGLNTLVTTSPDLIIRMSAARSGYSKGDWYAGTRIPPGQDNIFSQQDDEKLARRRAQMADGFSGKTNPSLEPTIDKHVCSLVNLLRSKYISTTESFRPVDMARKIGFYAMDVITDLAFGKPYGNLENDKDMYDYIQLTEAMIPVVVRMSAIPVLRTLFQTEWISKALFPSDTSEAGIGRLLGIAKKQVSQRYANKNIDHQDMISSFIAHGLTETDLVAESVMQILAGGETPATGFRSTLLFIITNPRVYATLQKEIDNALKTDGMISRPVVKDREWRQLEYLQAVVREGLRLCPPVTGLLSKVSPAGGDEFVVDGERVFIPGGTNIGWACWGMYRDKAVFGEDSELYRPERWLEEQNQDKLERMRKVVDLNFGYGKYYCLGRQVALSEMHKGVFELFRNFDLEIVNPARPWKSQNLGSWIQREMLVRVTERK